jgi:hypothetical protein
MPGILTDPQLLLVLEGVKLLVKRDDIKEARSGTARSTGGTASRTRLKEHRQGRRCKGQRLRFEVLIGTYTHCSSL